MKPPTPRTLKFDPKFASNATESGPERVTGETGFL